MYTNNMNTTEITQVICTLWLLHTVGQLSLEDAKFQAFCRFLQNLENIYP